jgi:hypothetical protein
MTRLYAAVIIQLRKSSRTASQLTPFGRSSTNAVLGDLPCPPQSIQHTRGDDDRHEQDQPPVGRVVQGHWCELPPREQKANETEAAARGQSCSRAVQGIPVLLDESESPTGRPRSRRACRRRTSTQPCRCAARLRTPFDRNDWRRLYRRDAVRAAGRVPAAGRQDHRRGRRAKRRSYAPSLITTRRLRARPSRVVFEAAGLFSP